MTRKFCKNSTLQLKLTSAGARKNLPTQLSAEYTVFSNMRQIGVHVRCTCAPLDKFTVQNPFWDIHYSTTFKGITHKLGWMQLQAWQQAPGLHQQITRNFRQRRGKEQHEYTAQRLFFKIKNFAKKTAIGENSCYVVDMHSDIIRT